MGLQEALRPARVVEPYSAVLRWLWMRSQATVLGRRHLTMGPSTGPACRMEKPYLRTVRMDSRLTVQLRFQDLVKALALAPLKIEKRKKSRNHLTRPPKGERVGG